MSRGGDGMAICQTISSITVGMRPAKHRSEQRKNDISMRLQQRLRLRC